jgi:Purine catabolism regulatory protein-like family/PucR C-terminal helix-turn-helix domain
MKSNVFLCSRRPDPPQSRPPLSVHGAAGANAARIASPTTSALPSLQTILDLPAFRSAELISGSVHLDEPVTWVHIAEIMDVWRFLSGGELLLSTGLELTRVSPPARRAYLHGLAKAGVRALGLELVQWIHEVPSEIVDAARILQFPIIIFRDEVSFSELTRAAHEEILRPKCSHGHESTMETLLNSIVETGRDKAFLDRQLGPLLGLPPRPRSTLLATLETLLNVQFNIAVAARKLGVRRQSIYYRLEQLTGLLGSLSDPSRKLGLLVAFALLRRSTTTYEMALPTPRLMQK